MRLGLTTYAFGLFLRDEEEREEGRPVSFPLTNIFLSGGFYLHRAEKAVRAYFDGAVFARIMHVGGDRPRLEPIAPLGWRPATGVEFGGERRLRFFVDYGPFMYLGDVELMKAALTAGAGDDGFPGAYLFGTGWLDHLTVDFIGYRLGLRWQM